MPRCVRFSVLLGLLCCLLYAGCSGTPRKIALAITTASLPSGSVSGAYAATVKTAGGMGPFAWSVASGALPGGLSLGASTTNSVTIAGTPLVQDSFSFTIRVSDSTGASATSPSLTISVSNLAITTTSPLPAGSVGAPYSLQFAAIGGTPPFRWSVAAQSTLPAGLTLSSSGLLSGAPNTQGTGTFSVAVTDTEASPATVTQSFSVTISGVAGMALLNGNYAFEFSGFNSAGTVVVGGSFLADGAGNIQSGVEDLNTVQGPPGSQTFAGTYTLGSDNRGTLTFNLTGSVTYTYAFAIDSTGAQARFIEFDSSGIRGSGEIKKQTVTTCGTTTISGTAGEAYVFGVTGSASAVGGSTPGPVVVAGAFTAQPPAGSGQQGNVIGEADVNIPGIFITTPNTTAPPLTGTFQKTSQASRCTLTIKPSQTSSSMNFSVYPVSGTAAALTEAFVVETDTVAAATPYLTAGKLIQQCILVGVACATSPFLGQTPGSFFTGTSVGALTGQFFDNTTSSYVPDVAIAEMTGTSGTSFTMSVVENQAGNVGTFQSPFTANFDTLDQDGRVATFLTSPFNPVFYIIGQNEALCIGQIGGNPLFGTFQPQSTGPFSAATVKGTFAEGTSVPTTNAVRDNSGVITLDGIRTVTGTQDESTSMINTPAQAVAGSYSNVNASAGSGVVTLTAPSAFTGSFFIVSPTQFVLVTTTTGDLNPVLIIAGH